MPHASPAARRAYCRRWAAANTARIAANAKRDRDKLKREVLDAYGGKCACCGEPHPVFLTLDHPNGDGAQRRREEGHTGGTAQYRRLRRLGFPPGYRVLCWNCNSAIHILGSCPHVSG